MNSLETCVLVSPNGTEDICAKFVVDTPTDPFVLGGVTAIGQKYTLRFWVRTDEGSSGAIQIGEKNHEINGPEWVEYLDTFIAIDDDLIIHFDPATYYIYHLKLEIGNKATDWAPAPEDIEEAVDNAQQAANVAQDTADGAQASADDANQKANEAYDKATSAMASLELQEGRITALVESAANASMMVQTENGWVFSMGVYNDRLNDIKAGLDNMTEYVKIGRFYIDGDETNTDPDNVRPCIDLGESDTYFKARITNTSFDLMDNKEVKTRVDRDGISTSNIAVGGEIKQNNPNDSTSGYFIWSVRANGNYGLTWKGETV